MEISMEYIKAQLQRRSGERQLPKVVKGSGVALRTLHRIIKGQGDTQHSTVVALNEYLKRTEQVKRLSDGGE